MPTFAQVKHFHLRQAADAQTSSHDVSTQTIDSDVKPFYQLGRTSLHDSVQQAMETGVHSKAHHEWVLNRPTVAQAKLKTETVSEGPLFGYKNDNPYAQPKRNWGTFRAPLRDFQSLIHRASAGRSFSGSDCITRAQLESYLNDTLSQEALSDTQVYEKNIGQLLLSYFDTVLRFGNSQHTSNNTVLSFSNVIALAEAVSTYYAQNKARYDNPYVLGLSDTDLEVAAGLSLTASVV